MKKSQIGSFPPEQVAAIGRAVSKFMREQGLKSEDVRRASGFNASSFAPLQKGGLTYLSTIRFTKLMQALRTLRPVAFDHFWNMEMKEILV